MKKLITSNLIASLLMISTLAFTFSSLQAQCAPDVVNPVVDCSLAQGGLNLLNNPSFEKNAVFNVPRPADWVDFNVPAFAIDARIIPTANDGDFYLKMFGPWSGIYQDHPVSPGDNLVASAYIRNAGFDQMQPGCEGFIKFDYLNSGGGIIPNVVVESNRLTNSLPLDVWTQVTMNEIVPPGVATVRMVLIMNCPAGGAVMFDDASLVNTTAPAPPLGNVVIDNEPDMCGAQVSMGIPVTSDNCGLAAGTLTNDFNSTDNASGFYPVGTTTVTWSVLDQAGNTGSCTLTVTVNDVEAPVIDCPVPQGPNILTNNSFEGAVHDQQGSVPNWLPFGAVFPLNQNNVPNPAQDGTFYLKTFGGNSGIFQDNPVQAGDLVVASIYVQNASFDPMQTGSNGFLKLEYINSTGGIISVSESSKYNETLPRDVWTLLNFNDVAPAGAVTVRFVAITQNAGGGAIMYDNAALSTFPASAGLPSFINVGNDPGMCGAMVSLPAPNFTDNCATTTIVNDYNSTNDASGMYPVGTTTVQWIATDAAGNADTCEVDVTVNDTEGPIASNCPTAVTVCNDGINEVSYVRPTWSDNCDGGPLAGTLIVGPDSGAVLLTGSVPVIWVGGSDSKGNPATAPCIFTVTVVELPSATNNQITLCNNASIQYGLQQHMTAFGNGIDSDFSWVAAPVAGVTGISTMPQTGDFLTDTPDNTTGSVQTIQYTVTPTSTDGCPGTPFTVDVSIRPRASSNIQALPANICYGGQVNLASLVRDYSLLATRFDFYDDDPYTTGQFIGTARTFRGIARVSDQVMVSPTSDHVYYIVGVTRQGCRQQVGVLVTVDRSCGRLPLSAKLEGAFDISAGNMRTTLNTQNLLPTTEPYTSLGYTFVGGGGESITATVQKNTDIVDWVLVELRDQTDPRIIIASRAALLLKDGTIVDTDGVSDVRVNVNTAVPYHVAILHRNHVGVMTANAVMMGTSLDFSDPNFQIFGAGATRYVSQGNAMLVAGDADGNGQVQNTDDVMLWMPAAGKNGYQAADYNLDGQVQNSDKILIWTRNVGRGTAIPR
ncbi:MAG: HYR domain-containing protein [Bacteroidia bacterium]